MNTMGGDLGGDEGGEEAVLGGLGAVRDQVDGEILDDPAADNGVVGHDEGGDQEGEVSQKFPLPVQGGEGIKGVLLGAAADGHVCGQQHEAEGQHQYQIYDQEQSAAVLGAEVGEPSDVANAHGAAGGRQDKAQGTAETALFIFHLTYSFLFSFLRFAEIFVCARNI